MNSGLCVDNETKVPIIEIPPSEEKALDSLQRWIYTTTGMNYPLKKRGILYSRLKSLCWRLGLPSVTEMDELLQEGNAEWLATEVARAVSTNFTFFFREIESLEFMRAHILPAMANEKKLRIWSAAAASGEEAYSVAILLAEALGLEAALERAAILGTDISYPMIEQAEQAVYVDQRLESLAPHLLMQYFESAGRGKWRVLPKVRQMCTFRRINLMSNPWPFRNPFHIILCRNIFYYFDQQQQLELVERLYDATVPNGWLITSVTETFHSMPIRWRRVAAGVWVKR